MRKQRQDPMQEGYLQLIGEILIAPLLKQKPKQVSQTYWLEAMFNVQERTIHKYVARKPFEMPGLYKAAGNVAIQGVGYRTITPGVPLWVRTDTRTPNIYEVEASIGVGQRDHWFQLDMHQWHSIALMIERDERVK